MREIKLTGLDQSVFFEKLKNGLEIYMIPFQNKTNYSMHYVTKYGSTIRKFIPYGKTEYKEVPEGIAHFLEHKMFEQEDGVDPFAFAARTGTDSNAMTSYNSTQYLFHGSSNFKENLDYLLKYVHSPYFTEENVEKEKGIIAEEIKQYDDDPEWTLDEEIRKAIYEKDHCREDIAGTVEEIYKITKEDLYDCYSTFYQPSNMFLIITGDFDVEEALEVVKNQKEMLAAPSNFPIQIEEVDEPATVFKKTVEIEDNIVNTKVSHAIKVPIPDNMERFVFSCYLGMMQSIEFGISSLFREEMRKKELMTSFYCDRQMTDKYMMLSFVAESEKPEELLSYIKKYLNNIDIKEEDIRRISKVWISSEVMMTDHINVTLENILGDIIDYGKVIDNKVEIYRNLSKEELDKVISNIDFTNSSTLIMRPKNRQGN